MGLACNVYPMSDIVLLRSYYDPCLGLLPTTPLGSALFQYRSQINSARKTLLGELVSTTFRTMAPGMHSQRLLPPSPQMLYITMFQLSLPFLWSVATFYCMAARTDHMIFTFPNYFSFTKKRLSCLWEFTGCVILIRNSILVQPKLFVKIKI